MDVFNATDTKLTTTWQMGVRSRGDASTSGNVTTYPIVVGTILRDAATKSIAFETSNIPTGSTVVRATLSATAKIERTQGSASKGYKFDDAEVCSLDATKITSEAFEKDITPKFASMNGGTFTDLSIDAKYRAKFAQFNGKLIQTKQADGSVTNSYQYSTAYGAMYSTQVAQLTLSNLKISVYYTDEGGEVTPATKWQKCEVYVCVPVS